ncbi:MAG: nucleotidyltransferase family protein [Pseudomonadota bacterium]
MATGPKIAFVAAAGLGKRMRPLTATAPKPLIEVKGKSLIDYGLDTLAAAGVTSAVVNVHYFPDLLEIHLAKRNMPQIVISDERDQRLETGGGVKKALDQLGKEPFFYLNSDSFWIEGVKPNFQLLAETWDPEKMDCLLLLASTVKAAGFHERGDFSIEPDGRLKRREESVIAPFAYAGAAIINPRIFDETPNGPFSMNVVFDRALADGRLFGAQMEGIWIHVGTPEAIAEAEYAIDNSLS